MSTYRPGTVAIATVKGKSDVRVMRGAESNGPKPLAWATSRAVDGNWWFSDDEVTDVRPLVVLDPDTIDTPTEIREHLDRVKHISEPGWLHRLADQIDAQTKPPRIPEPGLWGVVEAHTAGNPERFRFGRTQHGAWVKEGSATHWDWDELIDPTLVRPGVEDGAS